MYKSFFIFVTLVIIAVTVIFVIVKPTPLFSPLKSKVIVQTAKTTKTEGGDLNTVIPMAEMPVTKVEDWQTITCVVINAQTITKDTKSNLTVLLKKDNDIIVPLNKTYVNTLLYFYADKKVDISGKWKGEEKVNGTKCKKFWIEGIELNDEK